MRILVVGGSGMLGSDFLLEVVRRGWEAVAPTSTELDISDPSSVAGVASGAFGKIDWCVNCAGYTRVDLAESEVRLATELNAIGPGYLAAACATTGAEFLHVSSDYVFDGASRTPYRETDPPNPQTVYGRTKLEGERAVQESHPAPVVFRTSWLFGPNGPSFPRTMIRIYEDGKPLRVVDDQFGCPTYTSDLADTIGAAIERKLYPGTYHASGPEAMSWHGVAERTLLAWSGTRVQVEGISSRDWPTAAARPAYSVLDCDKLASVGLTIRPGGIERFVDRLRHAGLK
jgi:dTDP-4-dehydrorhamnose reductase